MKIKIGLVSLGCAKNQVDSEQVLGMLNDSGFEIVSSPSIADVIIVNTCGFISSSKEESIDTILEMAKYNKKLIVIGCLVERYLDELKKELPEVDLFVPIREYHLLKDKINQLMNNSAVLYDFSYQHRLPVTPHFTAYLRISEGCNNRCTYCAIPLIRGGFKSRPFDEVIDEARILASRGIKELVVISQDTTRYGSDFENPKTITNLLEELLKIKEFDFIRLLYLYPDEIEDDLLRLIATEPRLTPYFDLPIQHASSKILKSMNRRGDKEFLLDLINNRIRKIVPNAILRTTIIVGFPGETDEDFNELLEFVKEIRFDHLGAFTYSREEGTASYDFNDQVDEDVKNTRYQKLMREQRKISYLNNKEHIGKIMEGLVVGIYKDGSYLLRSWWNAPDDIDGNIIFKSHKQLQLGQKVRVRIIGCYGYDLEGEEVE